MLLSVIVPIYNAGDYLLPCVKSILALPLDIEVILVDDGSTDGAVDKLLQSLADEDLPAEKFRLVRQPNGGVSTARNRGLLLAQGDWVWFVDADDTVDGSQVEALDVRTSDRLLLLPYRWEQDGKASDGVPHDGEVPYNLWRCWFRRDVIEQNRLRFTEGRKYAEDQEFILNYLLVARCRTRALAAPQYHYVMRASGAMLRPGTRSVQRHDVMQVLRGFVCRTFSTGQWTQGWVWKEMKRLLKTISVI